MAIKKRTQINIVREAIKEWMKGYGNTVAFIGSFVAFDEDSEIIENLIIGYGSKEVLKISLKSLTENLEKEEDFVNW